MIRTRDWTEVPIRRSVSTFLFLALVPLLMLFAACEAPEEQPGTMDEPAETMDEPAEPAPQEAAPADVSVPLDEVNGSGVSGEAMAMHDAESITVMVEVEGLAEEGEYAAHIHSGSCAEGGGVAAPLDPVLGLPDGTGSSTTILEPDALDPDESYFIQVHGEGGAPIACGDVEGHGAGDGDA